MKTWMINYTNKPLNKFRNPSLIDDIITEYGIIKSLIYFSLKWHLIRYGYAILECAIQLNMETYWKWNVAK